MKRKNMMRRNLVTTIRRSLGRYIATVAIIALGAGLFTGLRVTKVDMIATVQRYTDRQNMFDLQVMNSYGWTDDDVFALSQTEYVIDRVKWLYDHRHLIGGLRFVHEPRTLRFFTGRLEPIGDWPQQLLQAYIADFGADQ